MDRRIPLIWKTLGLTAVLLVLVIPNRMLWGGPGKPTHVDTLLTAAREIMTLNPYCALITTDAETQPVVRTMNPFPPDSSFRVWFATNRESRKVSEIRRNPRVCLYYANHAEAIGYVALYGRARIVDDKRLLKEKKRAYWENIPDWENLLVLIEVIPERIEIIAYRYGLVNDPVTWAPPHYDFREGEP